MAEDDAAVHDDSIVDDNTVNQNGQDSAKPDASEDLYDAVLTSNGKRDSNLSAGERRPTTVSVSSAGSGETRKRRYSVYVGNMTWWTTDQDVSDLVASVGIVDLLDVKFYENRTNGQSKGFAAVSFASEASQRAASDKLPNKEIHGQKLVIMPFTRQSLSEFENATKRSEAAGRSPRDSSKDRAGGQQRPQNFIGTVRIGTGPGPNPGIPTQVFAQFAGRPPTSAPPHMPPPGFPPAIGPRPLVYPPGMMPPPTSGPPNMPPPAVRFAPPPGVGMPPPLQLPPGVSAPMIRPGASLPMTRPPPTMPTHAPGAPAPHLNPSFYRPPTSGAPMMSHPPPMAVPGGAAPAIGSGTPTQPVMPPGSGPHLEQISEAEFEEIMNRNKTVSSSAISRAVSDASAGDYAAAIETLVTAISLIRQSRVAHDDRCKILVASLQDTLHGIESKSYGREKHRSRDRSRSRDRDREARRERKRRERTPRSRSRSRDRIHRSEKWG